MHVKAALRCLACLLLLALGSCPSPARVESRLIFEDLDAGLLSVWGTSSSDVWTVGGDVDERGPLVLHYDGHAWSRESTGAHGDLWWVHGFEEGPVFFGGEGGMILRFEHGAFSRMETPSDQPIVFGIWGSSPDDVFAVGGLGRAAGFVWHWDGTRWANVALPPGFGGQSLFKVWGTRRGDAWIVGTDGAVLHWNGTSLDIVNAGTTRTLFTVHVVGETIAAVGGAGSGVLIERDFTGSWRDMAPPLLPQLFGVYLTPSGGAAVGINGTLVRREQGRWTIEETGLDLAETLHSVWIDPDGGIWGAGGRVLAEPLVNGVLIYRGRDHIHDGRLE